MDVIYYLNVYVQIAFSMDLLSLVSLVNGNHLKREKLVMVLVNEGMSIIHQTNGRRGGIHRRERTSQCHMRGSRRGRLPRERMGTIHERNGRCGDPEASEAPHKKVMRAFFIYLLRQYLMEFRRARYSEVSSSKHAELKSIYRYRNSIRTITECITKVSGKRLIINAIEVNIAKRTRTKEWRQ